MLEKNEVCDILKVLVVVLCISVLGFLIVVPTVNAISSARIDSWLLRAKDAGNPAQVAEFLGNYKEALYKNNRVEGKYCTLFRYPGSYMPTYIRAIDGLIARAEALALQDPTDESYQMGLINLEKDLGDIEGTAFGVWVAHGGWIWFVLLGTSIIWLSAIGLIGWMKML